ncbi:hypothetical protein LC605_32635 [Nostoc sp. CHAB 5836]|uniref:hypothetical protein n=1 Tax=Nostoc sp. CHAB 5836 TaxID=2780404 RepID=UPI001E6110A1|nr:hypothetical protein [Nostoc sp. CHAB 5836]MCC5619691.1 hypothetical protein [Nostoc sp. CHAB 5836]
MKIEMKPSKDTNLMVIKKTKYMPVVGDLFAGNVLGKQWIIGRVIKNGFSSATAKHCHLIYIYKTNEIVNPFDVEFPIKINLLFPPFLMLSNMMWTKGYFIHIKNHPLLDGEFLLRHIFESSMIHKYVDECGDPTSEPKSDDVVGRYSFQGWSSLDDKISNALGVPTHPSHE